VLKELRVLKVGQELKGQEDHKVLKELKELKVL
jgi:hypothetical protein